MEVCRASPGRPSPAASHRPEKPRLAASSSPGPFCAQFSRAKWRSSPRRRRRSSLASRPGVRMPAIKPEFLNRPRGAAGIGAACEFSSKGLGLDWGGGRARWGGSPAQSGRWAGRSIWRLGGCDRQPCCRRRTAGRPLSTSVAKRGCEFRGRRRSGTGERLEPVWRAALAWRGPGSVPG